MENSDTIVRKTKPPQYENHFRALYEYYRSISVPTDQSTNTSKQKREITATHTKRARRKVNTQEPNGIAASEAEADGAQKKKTTIANQAREDRARAREARRTGPEVTDTVARAASPQKLDASQPGGEPDIGDFVASLSPENGACPTKEDKQHWEMPALVRKGMLFVNGKVKPESVDSSLRTIADRIVGKVKTFLEKEISLGKIDLDASLRPLLDLESSERWDEAKNLGNTLGAGAEVLELVSRIELYFGTQYRNIPSSLKYREFHGAHMMLAIGEMVCQKLGTAGLRSIFALASTCQSMVPNIISAN